MDLITPDFGLIFWQTVTLIVVLWVLGKFAWKPILSVIQEREENIEAALQAAEDAKEMAAQVKANKEALLRTAHAEREKIIEEATIAKSTLIEEAKVEAEKASKKAIEQTQVHIEKEKKAALAAVHNEVAALSVDIAEKLLQNELQHSTTQEKLIKRMIKEAQ